MHCDDLRLLWVRCFGRIVARNMRTRESACLPWSPQSQPQFALFQDRRGRFYVCYNPSVFFCSLRWHTAHFTSSLMVVNGNSGPYRSRLGSPSTLVTGLALPYGLPKLLRQITKNLVVSNALPEPPINGPHQSATSALPDKA